MKHSFKDVRVTSLKFEQDLKTKFPILRTRKHWCHWFYIRTFSKPAFLWSLIDNGKQIEYLGVPYNIVYADGYDSETIMNVDKIGVSMRVFTNTKEETFYIAVVTAWQGELFA